MPESPPPETLSWLRHAASCGQRDAQLTLLILERLEALEQRPIPGTVELAAPTPEAAPVATDEELRQIWERPGYVRDALRTVYDLGRQHGAAAAQPTPEAAPTGGLVERITNLLGHHGDATARAAIREVAAWMRETHGWSDGSLMMLEQEAGRG